MADASVKIRGGGGNATQIQSRAVDAAAPTDGQALAWSNSDSEWEPTTISPGSSEWTDTGTVLHPADSSGTLDNVVIGGTSLANSDIALGVDGSAVFNEQSADVDFRVESNGNANMLFVDGGEDRVGVGTGTPTEFFEVEGSTPFLSIRNTAETEAGIIMSDSAAPIAQFARLLLDSGSAESGLTAGFSIMTAGGNLTGTINATASTTVTGVGTAFLTELVVGDRLILRADGTSDALAEIRTITAIASDTSLTVATAFTDLGIDTTPAFEVRAMQFKSNGSIGMGINPTVGAEKVVLDGAIALKEQSSAPSATAGYAKLYALEDGNDANTTLLLHFADLSDSAAGSSSTKTQTASGDAAISTTQKKFGTHSLRLDGTGDYITCAGASATHTDWDMGAGDFTIEMWIRFDAAPNATNVGLMGAQSGSVTESGFYWYYEASDGRTWFRWKDTTGTRRDISYYGLQHLAANEWHHLAIVRHSAMIKAYVNGSLCHEDAANDHSEARIVGSFTLNDPDNALTIGAVDAGVIVATACYIDEVRISKGVARYKNSFTPESSAFPVLKLCTIDSGGVKRVIGEM